MVSRMLVSTYVSYLSLSEMACRRGSGILLSTGLIIYKKRGTEHDIGDETGQSSKSAVQYLLINLWDIEHEKDSTRLISTCITYWFTNLISQAVGVWYQHAQHGFHQVLIQDNVLVLVIFLLITKKKKIKPHEKLCFMAHVQGM